MAGPYHVSAKEEKVEGGLIFHFWSTFICLVRETIMQSMSSCSNLQILIMPPKYCIIGPGMS